MIFQRKTWKEAKIPKQGVESIKVLACQNFDCESQHGFKIFMFHYIYFIHFMKYNISPWSPHSNLFLYNNKYLCRTRQQKHMFVFWLNQDLQIEKNMGLQCCGFLFKSKHLVQYPEWEPNQLLSTWSITSWIYPIIMNILGI